MHSSADVSSKYAEASLKTRRLQRCWRSDIRLAYSCCRVRVTTSRAFTCPAQALPCRLAATGLPHRQSARLHAQLSQITAIVRLCYSIRQLQLSEYTCRWENRIIGRSMSYPGTIGGAVPISTSGNRNTSSWPLYVTSNNKLQRHSIKMAYEERDEHIFVHFVYGVHDNYTN